MGLIKEILLANFTNCWKLRPDNAEDNQQLFVIKIVQRLSKAHQKMEVSRVHLKLMEMET